MDDHGSEVRRRCDDSLDVGVSSKGVWEHIFDSLGREGLNRFTFK